jgi:Predicted metal-dependent RNase, consists of a metallo-beta-lactamase domain and an RNA-binding KH domain
VGRAQEVLLFLDDNINSGALPKVPIYVDGMINKAMRIHRHNVIYCRKELQSRILMSEYDPFKSKNFVVVDKKGTRNKIVTEEESAIIVTTSGMLSGGPVFFYLSKLAGNSLNKMIMVGYQAEGTLGREMQDGNRHITIDKTKVDVQLKVETYHLSAHADRKGLESVMSSINGLKNVFIVHGEKSKSESLKEYASKKYKP